MDVWADIIAFLCKVWRTSRVAMRWCWCGVVPFLIHFCMCLAPQVPMNDKPSTALVEALSLLYAKASFSSFDEEKYAFFGCSTMLHSVYFSSGTASLTNAAVSGDCRLLRLLDAIAMHNPHPRVQRAAVELIQKMVCVCVCMCVWCMYVLV